jgi:hypothetical protein
MESSVTVEMVDFGEHDSRPSQSKHASGKMRTVHMDPKSSVYEQAASVCQWVHVLGIPVINTSNTQTIYERSAPALYVACLPSLGQLKWGRRQCQALRKRL